MGIFYFSWTKFDSFSIGVSWKKAPLLKLTRIAISENPVPFPEKPINTPDKTVSGLISMLYSDPSAPIPSEYLDFSAFTEFQLKIHDALRRNVPPGKVISYSRLAALAEHKGASRAVGTAMAENMLPLYFPCHRVIKESGELGNFGPGASLKKLLLEREGVIASNCNTIDSIYYSI